MLKIPQEIISQTAGLFRAQTALMANHTKLQAFIEEEKNATEKMNGSPLCFKCTIGLGLGWLSLGGMRSRAPNRANRSSNSASKCVKLNNKHRCTIQYVVQCYRYHVIAVEKIFYLIKMLFFFFSSGTFTGKKYCVLNFQIPPIRRSKYQFSTGWGKFT